MVQQQDDTRKRANGSSPSSTNSVSGNGALDFVPPNNVEAEQAVLGSMLIEREAIDKATQLLVAEDFTRPDHQLLFKVITGIAAREVPVDKVTLSDVLASEHLESAGGKTYVMSLFDNVPTAVHVEHYARIVQKKATLRRLLATAHDVIRGINTPDAEPSDVIAGAELAFAGIADRVASAQGLDLLVDMADAWGQEDEEPPRIFGDFLVQGCQTVLSSPGGMGKTTLIYNLISHLAEGRDLWDIPVERPYKVLAVDVETPAFLRTAKLRKLYLEEQPIRGNAFFMPAVSDFGKLLRDCKRLGIDLVIFDTASRCFPRIDENSNSEVYEKVVPILDAFKKAGIATLVVTHTSKGGTGTRGASAFTDAVDVALSLELHEGKQEDPDAVLALKTLKNRAYGFPPSVLLQRDGFDRFRRVEASPKADEADAPLSARVRCANDVIDFLRDLGEKNEPAKFGEIVKAMIATGHAEGTAKKVVSHLQKEGKISFNIILGGYVLEES